MSNSTGKKFIKNLIGFSLSSWISFAISFISTPIITRLFSTDEVGKINLFTTYLTMFLIISYLGLDQAYIRFYNEPPGNNSKKGLFTICTSISLVFTMIVSVVVLILRNRISNEISGSVGWIVPVCIVLSLIANILLRFFNIDARMEKNVIMYSIQGVTLVIIGKLSYIIVAFWNPNHISAIITMTMGYIIISYTFMIISKKDRFTTKLTFNANVARELFTYAIPLLPITLLSWLNNSVGQLMLKRYVSYSAIGIYTNAVAVAGIITLLQAGFNTYWLPFVYETYKTGIERIQKVHHLITFLMVLFGLSIVLFQDIIYLIIGKNFRASKEFFPFLLLAPVCYTIAETTGLGINISKKSYLNIITFIGNTGANLILCIILLPRIGIVGAAISAASSAVVMLIIKTVLGEKYYKCCDNYIKMGCAVLIMIVAAVLNLLFYKMYLVRYIAIIALIIVLMFIYKSQVKYLVEFAVSEIKKLYSNWKHNMKK